jgi:hypothetical protein
MCGPSGARLDCWRLLLSSRHNMVSSIRFALYSLLALPFRCEECHNIQPWKATSMSLTEPDLWISHIRLFGKAHVTGDSVCRWHVIRGSGNG